MANGLTGDFDAVVEIGVGAINAMLATAHQNGPSDDAPGFMHSCAFRIGDPSILAQMAQAAQLSQWVASVQSASFGAAGSARSGRSGEPAYRKAPPGIAAALNTAITELVRAQAEPGQTGIQREPDQGPELSPRPATVRGLVQAQLGPPRVTFPPNSTSEVTAHVETRARYLPDPNTVAMPEFVHGEVRATMSVAVKYQFGKVGSKYGIKKKLLVVSVPDDDSKIQFVPAPGSGLSNADAIKVENEIRKILRQSFEPANVSLPNDLPFSHFKALGSGTGQAIALPLQLSGGLAPVSGINSINNLFLKAGDEFAVGINKDYILSFVQPSLDGIKASHPKFNVVSWFFGTAHYTVNFDQASATWSNGKIHIYVHGTATTPAWWSPNGSFSASQDLQLQLDVPGQTIKIIPVGSPSVSVNVNGPFGGLVQGQAQQIAYNRFVSERDKALAAAQSQIHQALSGNGNINNALKPFDSSAYAKLRALESTADGMILRGDIGTKPRSEVVVEVHETADGMAYSALKTWIPAGTIEEFIWSWTEKGALNLPWANASQMISDKHRFILPKPAKVASVCLTVTGDQTWGGWVTGSSCESSGHDLKFTMPGWWDKIMLPFWLPDPAPEGILEEAIAGHIDVLASSPRAGEAGANSIVHFTDLERGKPLQALNQALAQVKRRDAPITLVVVLARGALRNSRADVERQLGVAEAFSGSVMVTEDYEGGWSRVFGAKQAPATFLTNARGEFVWGAAGEINAAALAATLDEHLVAGLTPRVRPLNLNVRIGARATDVLLQADEDFRIALRRFRRQPILLNFWQSWSAPCLKELRHLQNLQQRSGGGAPTVIAINGGEPAERLDEVSRQHDLTLSLVSDPDLRIAKRYGVSCWPTTVSINADGIVDRIQFGVTHAEAGRLDGPRTASSSAARS